MDYSTIIDQLYNALLDKEVAGQPELYGICLQAKKELEQKEPENLVFTRFSRSLSWYLLCHKYQAPKSIIELAMAVEKIAQEYRSQVAWSQLLGSLFSGGRN